MVYLITKKGKRHLIRATERNGVKLTALEEARRIIESNFGLFSIEEDATPVKNEKSKKILKEVKE